MKENNKINISIEKNPRRITKTNNIISNDSISEKNEESSNSTLKNNALQSGNMLKKKIIKSEVSKNPGALNTSIKKSKRQTIDVEYNNKKIRGMKRKNSRKKSDLAALKRISFQQNNALNFYNNFRTREFLRKKSSLKKLDEISNNQKSFDYSSRNVNHIKNRIIS